MKTEHVFITPEMAAKMLRDNTGNRRVRHAHVQRLTDAMANGEWKETHQGVAVSESGKLIDGQHRLMAIVQSGIGQWTNVSTGVRDDSFTALDQGEKRSVADMFHISPVESAVLGRIAREVAGSYARPSVAYLEKINACFGPLVHELCEFAPSTTKVYGTTIMRMAAIAHIVGGDDKKRVFDTFYAISRVDVDSMPPIAHAFMSQVARGSIVTSGTAWDYVARCWLILHKNHANSMKLVVRDAGASRAEMVGILREHFSDWCKRQ